MTPYRTPAEKEKDPMDDKELTLRVTKLLILGAFGIFISGMATCLAQTGMQNTTSGIERAKHDAEKAKGEADRAMWEKMPAKQAEK